MEGVNMSNGDRIKQAAAARKKLSERQREKAREALEPMVEEGLDQEVRGISVAAVASRAGVSRDLIYSMPDLLEQIKTLRDRIPPAAPSKKPKSAAQEASLKVKLAHAAKEIT